jgi:hypothetical protein
MIEEGRREKLAFLLLGSIFILFDRTGYCYPQDKVLHAQEAGAVGVIISRNRVASGPGMTSYYKNGKVFHFSLFLFSHFVCTSTSRTTQRFRFLL